MERTIVIVKAAILMALFLATYFLLGCEVNSPDADFIIDFVMVKGAGFGCAYLMGKPAKRWQLGKAITAAFSLEGKK